MRLHPETQNVEWLTALRAQPAEPTALRVLPDVLLQKWCVFVRISGKNVGLYGLGDSFLDGHTTCRPMCDRNRGVVEWLIRRRNSKRFYRVTEVVDA